MQRCRLILSFAIVFAATNGVADEKSGAGPTAAPAQQVVSPRDPASGLPTGKRMHKPLRLNEEGFELVDGRYLVVDRTTGQVRFGDGVEGKVLPGGAVLDATYRTGNGRTLVVKGGKLVGFPTPAPTPVTASRDAAKMSVKIAPEITRMKKADGKVDPAGTPPPPK